VSSQDRLGWIIRGGNQESSTGLGYKAEVTTDPINNWPYNLKLEYNDDET